MTQQPNPVELARNYLRQQGEKGFGELEALMTQSGDDWDACLRGVSEKQAIFQPKQSDFTRTPYSGEGPTTWLPSEA